jgi:CheY-like chemotaxis protein
MKTILLVEDDETFRYSATEHLMNAGFVVIAAADSIAALCELETTVAIDLLLTDVVMPEGKPHGISLANMARMRRARLPVIFMTGYGELLPMESEFPGPVFHKPVDMHLITHAIYESLSA